MDVETAFLNSKVKGKVYVKLPPGQHSKSGKVYRVLRALYGLKDSPRQWYDHLHEFLTKRLKFKRSKIDYCLYFTKIENLLILILILIFVDDFLICCKDLTIIDKIKRCFCEKF